MEGIGGYSVINPEGTPESELRSNLELQRAEVIEKLSDAHNELVRLEDLHKQAMKNSELKDQEDPNLPIPKVVEERIDQINKEIERLDNALIYVDNKLKDLNGNSQEIPNQ